jgi:hypothetical protein
MYIDLIRKALAVCADTSTALVTRFDDGKISHESRVRKYQWCNDVSILKLVGEKRRFRSRAFLYVPYSGFRD